MSKREKNIVRTCNEIMQDVRKYIKREISAISLLMQLEKKTHKIKRTTWRGSNAINKGANLYVESFQKRCGLNISNTITTKH